MRYRFARKMILVFLGLSTVNMLNVIFGGTEYYIYAASIPYSFSFEASYLTGRLPNEYYIDWPETLPLYDMSVFWIDNAIAFGILLLYLGIFFITRKTRPSWYIVTCVFVVIDFVYRFIYFQVDSYLMLEVAFVAFFLLTLIVGIINGFKLKKLQAIYESVLATDT